MSSILKDMNGCPSIKEEDDTLAYAMYLGASSAFTNVLIAAVQLGLLDIIAAAGAHVSASEIASQLPTQNPDAASIIDRMLRVLACHSILSCSLRTLQDGSVERLYGVAPIGKALVSSNEGGQSLASLFKPQKVMEVVWSDLKDLVLNGGNLFDRVLGMPMYEYMNKNPELSRDFGKAMSDISKITMTKVVDEYKGFEGLTSLVDVGGGTGASLNMIISKYPSIKGINFDVPHVIQNAPSYSGINHIGGDMFSSIPNADAIMLKSVLHNWSDEHCLKLLKKCYNALPKNGKVIVLNYVIPEAPESSITAKHVSHMDILMLFHPGGKGRTEREYKALCKGAGFSDFRISCYAYYVGIMEFLK